MAEKKEGTGYYTEDRNIYFLECIDKKIEILNEVDHAITAKDSE
jgi:hypothetical protein